MFDSLFEQIQHPNLDFLLEAIAVITAIIYVWLAARSNYWCFLFGFISSAVYVYICFQFKLYFDVIINLFYLLMSVIGWVSWKNNTEDNILQIFSMNKREFWKLIALGISITILLAAFATHFSDASLPYLDAFTTVFGIIATILVIQRKIENWLIWIAVDIVAISMYFYKGLQLTALLFLIYTIIAISGYISWKKQLNHD
ncbi:MAG: nicotinamide riboside transporter PnuC [Bacteroidetes bacterium]|nr:MAG: nicotinamide riboside transporter PnuC [Bacteroidota bacterium]MBL1144770.1 nicotinamide riboside transporter PnuC [Bacteroidota bacterium]NOG57564.1 nicotinamide mononucleotide transporter [Bacteroidota bacterium]